MDNREKIAFSIPVPLIAVLVLVILVTYTYAKFFLHPYVGFRVDATGEVIFHFNEEQGESELRIGDRLIRVDAVSWEEYQADLRLPIFPQAGPGQVLRLLIERDGAEMAISWTTPGPNLNEILDLIVNEGWLAYFFWAAGTFSLAYLRPKDDRWALMIAFNYLTAIFLAAGSGVSFYHTWQAAIVLRMAIWFCVPIYLHLHWIFAPTFRKPPKPVLWVAYSGAAALAAAEWFQWLPRGLYLYGFLLAFAGSFLLLLAHAVLRPQTRRDLRLLLWLSIIAIAPSIVAGIITGVLNLQEGVLLAVIGGGALLSLPLLPLAYLQAAYRRQLGNWEVRVNRFTSVYIFLILLGSVGLPVLVIVNILLGFREATMVVGVGTAGIVAAASIWGYPLFESWLETRILGIPLPSKQLLERYSNYISTSVSMLDLTRILQEEILPSLLIREFVFLYSDQGSLKALSSLGVAEEKIPESIAEMPSLHSAFLPPFMNHTGPNPWIRLVLPLRLGDRSIGFWLFGRRDPDDLYSQAEIPILRSLASQTAVALSNIIQTERLKAMYHANTSRYEEERNRLGRDLHDSVLNEMAAILIKHEELSQLPGFMESYNLLIQRLREIISGLRPPELLYGLKFGIEALADGLSERHHDKIRIVAEIRINGVFRYPEIVESNLYRIVQEACENALKYSQGSSISITGELREEEIDLEVADDGIGFTAEIDLPLDDMVANRHYGLAGMLERADLIGAVVRIHSKLGEGTQIHVSWSVKKSI